MTRIHDVIITISVSVAVSSNHGGIISVLSHLLFCQLCSCQILPCLLKHNEIFTKCIKQWDRIPYLEYHCHTLLAPLLHQLSSNCGLRDQWYVISMPDHLPSSIISQNPFFCWFVTTMRYCVILLIVNKQGGEFNRNENETFTYPWLWPLCEPAFVWSKWVISTPGGRGRGHGDVFCLDFWCAVVKMAINCPDGTNLGGTAWAAMAI